jgi:hypothetical protein
MGFITHSAFLAQFRLTGGIRTFLTVVPLNLMQAGLKTLMRCTLGAAALLAGASTASADYLYGNSNATAANKLIVNGVVELQPGENQGWWSGTEANSASNVNYFVGTLADSSADLNNFFVFDISDLTGPVTSAVLQLQFYNAFSTAGASTILYSLFDVSTEAAVLNQNDGTSWAIHDDLGSGNHYGSFAIATNLAAGDVVTLSLNGAGLADLNAAIDTDAQHFAIGGTLSFTPVVAPNDNEVPDSVNTLVLLGLAAVCFWLVRRKQAA